MNTATMKTKTMSNLSARWRETECVKRSINRRSRRWGLRLTEPKELQPDARYRNQIMFSLSPEGKRNNGVHTMTEEEYWASEMRDSDLDAAADAGEYFLEGSGFSMMPTQAEVQQRAKSYCVSSG